MIFREMLAQLLAFTVAVSVSATQCALLGLASESKPSPSLWKCYKYNKLACCVSTHDSHINDVFTSLMSGSCQRKFADLERYFCFGCSPNQGDNTDVEGKTITLCKDFAEQVWGGPLEYPSNSFDTCGLNTYWRTNSTTVLQSKEWPNAYAFFNELKPPYFEDYAIRIVGNDKPCYDLATGLQAAVLTLIFALN